MRCLNFKNILTLSFLLILGIPELQAQHELEIYPGGIVFPRLDSIAREVLIPVMGQFIYNTDTDQLNYYDGSDWQEMTEESLLSDKDEDTQILVEASVDQDVIRMYAKGSEVLRIFADSTG